MRLLPMGSTAVLVEDPPGGPAAWAEALTDLDLDGVIDVVPGARTVLVRCRRPHQIDAAARHFDQVDGEHRVAGLRHHVRIRVAYDGQDLQWVAERAGISVGEVVALHSAASYRVAFCGSAPGFAYLAGLPEALRLPRRDTPRMRVPAGSVAIASEYGTVYPRASPSGWHVLGRTRTTVFDVDRRPPALLRPGTTVRFEAT